MLPGDCVMSGQGWRLKGEIHRILNGTSETVPLNLGHLDIAAMVPPEWANLSYESFIVDTSQESYTSYGNDTIYMPMHGVYNWGTIGHHVSWTNTGIILGVVIVIICVGIYVYRRREKIRFFLNDAIRHRKKQVVSAKPGENSPQEDNEIIISPAV